MNVHPKRSIGSHRPHMVDPEVVPFYSVLLVIFCLFAAVMLFGAGSMLGGLLFSSILLPVIFYRPDSSPDAKASQSAGDREEGWAGIRSADRSPRSDPEGYVQVTAFRDLGTRMMRVNYPLPRGNWTDSLFVLVLVLAALSFLLGGIAVGVLFAVLLVPLAIYSARRPKNDTEDT